MSNFPESAFLSGVAPAISEERHPTGLETEIMALFEQMNDRLLRYLQTFRALVIQDCEEIVQEAFIALFHHLRQERSRHNLGAWLFRVVHNLALKRIQKNRRDSQTLIELSSVAEMAADRTLNPEEAFANNEAHRRAARVIEALSEEDRQCLALRTEGLRYREIASVLDISLGSVAKSLERSLARIARAVER